MIKANALKPFIIYRVKPPVIMYESESDRKKGQAYMVMAPTIQDEMKFLADTNTLRFRYLSKYFIEKRWEANLMGQGKKLRTTNTDGEIDRLLDMYQRGNLQNVKEVTSYLRTLRTNVLKDFNVLVEMNHVSEAVLQNPKDRRLPKVKAPALLQEWLRVIDIDYLGKYQRHIILPLDLWLTPDEFTNPDKTLRTISLNIMGVILTMLCDTETLSKFGEIMLTYQNMVLILNASAIPEKAKGKESAFIKKIITQFLHKRKDISSHDSVDTANSVEDAIAYSTDEEQDTGDDLAIDTQETTKAQAAAVDAKDEELADRVLTAAKADVSTVSAAEKKKVAKAVKESNKQPEVVPDIPDTDLPTSDPAPSTPVIKPEDIKVDDKAADAILAAKMKGTSVASSQRDMALKEKYKEYRFGTKTVGELEVEESALEIPEVPVHANVLFDSMKNISGHKFESVYLDKLYNHHLVSILTHFGTVDPALYLNKDIIIEDVSTRTDRMIRYKVEYEDTNRKRHRFSFLLPKMYKDKYLYLNNQELTITHQKLPFPITKVQADRCQLVTNYNKVFVYRHGTALSPIIIKLKKVLAGTSSERVKVTRGDCTILNKSIYTTIEFDELAASFVRIKLGTLQDSMTFLFDVNDTRALVDPKEEPKLSDGEAGPLFPVAIHRSKSGGRVPYWLSGSSNIVYSTDGSHGEFSEFIVEQLVKYDPALEKDFTDTSAGTKFVYSRARIMAQDIPLILVMAASDPDGLIGAMTKAKINFNFSEKRVQVDKDKVGVIPFSDGYLMYDRYPFENALLMNGLSVVPTKEYSYFDMGTRDTYVDIFDLMCGQRTLADNLASFYYMMIDPITKDVLTRLNMPTDFITLLAYCNGSLADNSFQIDSNYHNTRIRSTEIIMAHLYRHLAVAWSNYRSGRAPEFSIPENCVIKDLLTSKIIDPKSKLNITLELENDRNVKLKGPSGMNEDHSFTIEKRAYHPSMRGIVATNSTPSGEVGINRHMVTNTGINDALGFITVDKEDYDGTELMSPGEMLTPFGLESADIERVCMSISQAKHLVPVESQCSCPVSYDFERVAPYLSNDFAFVSKKAGKVVAIEENLMIVQYDDGTTDDVDLSEHPVKNTDGGFFIMNKMDTKLHVGSRFKEGEILAFDKKVINDLDFFGDPCANVGTLARVAFESSGNVYEDSGYMTDEFAHRFATKITKEKRVILSPFANIRYIAKIGQQVQANDPILAFDDTEDEFSAQLLASITDQMGDEDEVIATSAPVVSKYTGVIKDIQITYTVPISAMTPSLQKIVKEYSRDAAKRENVLHEHMDIRDANTIVKNSEMSVQDASGKVGGVKIGDGVAITFYIEYVDVAGNGDKGSIGALKFTTCTVIPTELAAFGEFNPDAKVDLYVSAMGAYKRMVADVEKIGVLTKVLVESKRLMKEKYHERIKAELKKLK